MNNFLYGDTTDKIIGCFFKVLSSNRKYRGYSEASFSAALAIELQDKGFRVREQVALRQMYKKRQVGIEYADMIVNDLIVIEIKKVGHIKENHINQALSYLQDSGLAVGLILNFGSYKPQIKRIYEKSNAPEEY
ncbi:MAG: GxxExxY protein [Anaerolineaceae bacterium]|nr:GxxExxY protein [Anaerolineaceae bacterium]